MSFLPEEDQEFLDGNGIKYQLLIEKMPNGGERRGVLFPGFALVGNLRMQAGGTWVPCGDCDLLVLIPDGYSTSKLDSFYTSPRLKRSDGTDPNRASGETQVFGRTWQFWSRHIDDKEWRVGVDGLRTYLCYVRSELRNA